MRLKDKVAIVVGAGQSPGEGIGNGRATVLRFVQEGATVMAVDRDLAAAEETAAMARQHGGPCVAFEADVTREPMLAAMVAAARKQFGRIDVLHYNVGLSIAGGDAPPTEITEEAFDRITAINLRGCVMAVKHVLPVMRAQKSGVILTISSLAAYEAYPYVTYKATKAAMIAFTQQVAIQNAGYGIRANCILPGLMDTPMAVDTRARHSLGRRQRRAVPCVRRGQFHHRRGSSGRRRRPGPDRIRSWPPACGIAAGPDRTYLIGVKGGAPWMGRTNCRRT
jgi:NAD(P)-dependent dehydrogenase (short-subunit alcohol dehydrogenase family)